MPCNTATVDGRTISIRSIRPPGRSSDSRIKPSAAPSHPFGGSGTLRPRFPLTAPVQRYGFSPYSLFTAEPYGGTRTIGTAYSVSDRKRQALSGGWRNNQTSNVQRRKSNIESRHAIFGANALQAFGGHHPTLEVERSTIITLQRRCRRFPRRAPAPAAWPAGWSGRPRCRQEACRRPAMGSAVRPAEKRPGSRR